MISTVRHNDWRPMAYLAVREPGVRSAIKAVLREGGWAVVESSNGYHLLHSVVEPYDGPLGWPLDLIVADAFTPDCAGIGLAAELRARGSRAPFVLLTANAAEAARVHDAHEDAIYTADRTLAERIVRLVASHRLHELRWSPLDSSIAV